MLSAALVAGCCELSRKHTRSPELFHELVLANGKMPTWQPRSGKVTGLWFNLIQDVKNASAKTLVLKSEAVRVLIGIHYPWPSSYGVPQSPTSGREALCLARTATLNSRTPNKRT